MFPLKGYIYDVSEDPRPVLTVEEWRNRMAVIAEQTADLADDFASIMEHAARRGDEQRRLRIARTERRIAVLQRRNARKLRQAGRAAVELEHLPSLKD
jgi:hypothetical protein